METPVKTATYKGYTIKIFRDDDAQNPIKDWDMLGTFSCLHGRYDLSCKKNKFTTKEEIEECINRKDVISLPLYLYDHSGITISTRPFSCPWDSGQVGHIWADKEAILKEFGKKRMSETLREKAIAILQNEVESFDKYLTGDVYGYVIEDAEGNEVDSCWGYMPTKSMDTDEVVTEAQSAVDSIENIKNQKFGKQAEMEFAE